MTSEESRQNTTKTILNLCTRLNSHYNSKEQAQHLLKEVSDLLKELSSKFRDENDIDYYKNLHDQCKLTPEFERAFQYWIQQRKKLLNALEEVRLQLDKTIFLSSILKMVGASTEITTIFSTFLSNEIRANIMSYAINWSPSLIISIDYLITGAPYLSIIACLGEILNSKLMVNKITELGQKDNELYKQLEELFENFHNLDAVARRFFPLGVDKDLVRKLEKKNAKLDSNLNLFATAFLPNFAKNPHMLSDVENFKKLVNFCLSDAGGEWFDRVLEIEGFSFLLEREKFYVRLDFNNIQPIPETAQEVGTSVAKYTKIAPTMLLVLNAWSLYIAYLQFKNRKRNTFSLLMQELARELKSHMEKATKAFEITKRDIGVEENGD